MVDKGASTYIYIFVYIYVYNTNTCAYLVHDPQLLFGLKCFQSVRASGMCFTHTVDVFEFLAGRQSKRGGRSEHANGAFSIPRLDVLR